MKNCVICQQDNAAYKCPSCKQPYCSVTCCRTHKVVPCQPEPAELPVETPKVPNFEFPTDDTVPLEKLALLRYNDEIKGCLSNPHVRTIVQGILSDPDPSKALAAAMKEPIFVELADACLKIVEEDVS